MAESPSGRGRLRTVGRPRSGPDGIGDGITSGAAGPRMMRTSPLWGVRAKSRFPHDGRAESITDAIKLHDGQATNARNGFNALNATDQQAVVDFLNTI